MMRMRNKMNSKKKQYSYRRRLYNKVIRKNNHKQMDKTL